MLKQSGIGKSVSESTGKLLSAIPLSPNQITALSVFLAIIGAYEFVLGQLWLAFALYILSTFCDLADGAIARHRNIVTKKGGFLDGVSDRLVEFFIIVALMTFRWPLFILPAYLWLAALLFFGSAMTSYISAYAVLKGLATAEESIGVFARPERMAFLLAAVGALAAGQVIAASLIVVLATLLAFGTASTRFIHFWLKKTE